MLPVCQRTPRFPESVAPHHHNVIIVSDGQPTTTTTTTNLSQHTVFTFTVCMCFIMKRASYPFKIALGHQWVGLRPYQFQNIKIYRFANFDAGNIKYTVVRLRSPKRIHFVYYIITTLFIKKSISTIKLLAMLFVRVGSLSWFHGFMVSWFHGSHAILGFMQNSSILSV